MLFTDETGEMILEKAAQSIGQWLRHLNNCAIVHMRINISESGRVVLKGFQQALADNRSMGFSLCVTEMEFLSGSKHIHTSALIYGATVNCGSVPETLTVRFTLRRFSCRNVCLLCLRFISTLIDIQAAMASLVTHCILRTNGSVLRSV